MDGMKQLKPSKKPLYNTIEGQEPRPGRPTKLIPMKSTPTRVQMHPEVAKQLGLHPIVRPPFKAEQIDRFMQRHYERKLIEMRQAESVLQSIVSFETDCII